MKKDKTFTDPLLENSLGVTLEQDNNIKSVSKELFSGEGEIDLKTEVSHDEVNMITKLRFLELKAELSNVDLLIDSFLKLRVSMARKSRQEFINALRSEDEGVQSSGVLSKLKRFIGAN